jgi:hypothetical protein
MPSGQAQPSLRSRLLWFVALWLAGVGTVTTIALVLRVWMKLA